MRKFRIDSLKLNFNSKLAEKSLSKGPIALATPAMQNLSSDSGKYGNVFGRNYSTASLSDEKPLLSPPVGTLTPPPSPGLSSIAAPPSEPGKYLKLSLWILINTMATVAIVFVNKRIFSDPTLRGMPLLFTSFHFFCTSLSLFVFSKAPLNFFTPKRGPAFQIAPICLAFCGNVVLPNLSLAFASVAFYQLARILVTPTTAIINLLCYQITTSRSCCLTLVFVCAGVAMVAYSDVNSSSLSSQSTSLLGVFFALAGVLASSFYTVLIGVLQKRLRMSSMQLLFNQAPPSTFLLLICVPFLDNLHPQVGPPIMDYANTLTIGSRPSLMTSLGQAPLGLVLLSGCLAVLINLSQFLIIAQTSSLSSTIVGHAKTVLIVGLGWYVAGKTMQDWGFAGVLLSIGGIVAYSWVKYEEGLKAAQHTASNA